MLVWSLQRLIGYPKILLRFCLLLSVLFVVLHNFFIFILVFLVIFMSFICIFSCILVIYFAGVVEGGAFVVELKLCRCENFTTYEISRFANFRTVAKSHLRAPSFSSLFISCNFSFPAPFP